MELFESGIIRNKKRTLFLQMVEPFLLQYSNSHLCFLDFNGITQARNFPRSTIVSLFFSPKDNYLVAVSDKGLAITWQVTKDNKIVLLGG